MEVNIEKLEIKAGIKIGQKLLKEMKDGKSSALFFAILLAVLIDFLDFLVIGQTPIIGTVIKLIGTIALTVILWGVGGFIKVKVRVLLWVVAPPIELIPFLATFPTYTLAIIWAYFKIKKKAEESEEDVNNIMKDNDISTILEKHRKEIGGL